MCSPWWWHFKTLALANAIRTNGDFSFFFPFFYAIAYLAKVNPKFFIGLEFIYWFQNAMAGFTFFFLFLYMRLHYFLIFIRNFMIFIQQMLELQTIFLFCLRAGIGKRHMQNFKFQHHKLFYLNFWNSHTKKKKKKWTTNGC